MEPGPQFKDWFHGTSESRVGRIQENGLRPSEPGLATVTTDRSLAESYARETAGMHNSTPKLMQFRVPEGEVRPAFGQDHIGHLDAPLPAARFHAVYDVSRYV